MCKWKSAESTLWLHRVSLKGMPHSESISEEQQNHQPTPRAVTWPLKAQANQSWQELHRACIEKQPFSGLRKIYVVVTTYPSASIQHHTTGTLTGYSMMVSVLILHSTGW
jgi:hypothetical protein